MLFRIYFSPAQSVVLEDESAQRRVSPNFVILTQKDSAGMRADKQET